MSKMYTPLPAGGMVTPAFFFNDTYEKKQWYLDHSHLSPLSIDAYSAWEDYRGSGVNIGVIDSQIDFRHTDLSKAYDSLQDYNFALASDQVTITDSDVPYYHGTAVAGIISAEAGNAHGTVGIAPDAKLVGLAIDYQSDDVVGQIVSALRASASLDVVNNSWSFVSNFEDDFNRHPEYCEAIEYAAEHGRNGLGTSIVFAAGNAGSGGASNYHNFQNSPFTIAVGAVNADGTPASFTSLGANVLLSAAGSSVYTTTLKDRYADYDGTSFAAPAVTATVGLMLEANPDLGYRDVQQILAYSAHRGGLSDSANFGDGWRTNGATTFNGGGLHFNDAFGYGFLNVHDAVRMAETWTGQRTHANLASASQSIEIDQDLVAGSRDHASARIEIGEDIDIEHVQVALDLRWVDTGDLDVYLTSPDGTVVRLVYDLPGHDRAGGLRNFVFDSVASMGERSDGTWTIDVYNRNPDATDKDGTAMTGLFQDATLTVLGSREGLGDDTYVYTDEFGSLYEGSDLSDRSTLHDADGGMDAINAAAVTSASTIDLSGASRTTIAGITLSLTANTIENAYSGDGKDTLIGSAANNVLHAGRGDDTIYFSFGNDTIDGGRGEDRLIVNASFGSITGLVAQDGTLTISTPAGGTSSITGMETFVFSDGTYAYSDLLQFFEAGGTAPPPEHDAPITPPDPDLPGNGGSTQDQIDDTPDAPRGPDTFDETGRAYDSTLTGTRSAEKIKGGAGADWIDGKDGDDKLLGYDGDDALLGGDGDDRMTGGGGHDYLDGGAGADRLFGNAGGDKLLGFDGDDLIKAGAGDDWIEGGSGRDRLFGGDGADTFVFDLADLDATDIIYDFDAEEGDRILVRGPAADAEATFEFERHGSSTYLEVHIGGETFEIARIKGENVDDLGMSMSMSNSDLGILWA
ncbi:S8 family serine peptidase [Novosphingobium malaysiense]|uniref:P/Homo B domain-containing protein n=1 Tax=Novosphingobium malaysiense TaxID=1348853 RepID=A0A0B1ZRM2_9SPHN|nr:S8 family serine peptidase [Novosphingobium malaysiense]KHK93226.1 hypothetical protein LK12_02570 [Novosphingobium malaysiense]